MYSIIVPVYNRPDEVDELLASLSKQAYKHFEVLIIEDGSTNRCEDICKKYSQLLDLQYFYKDNTGQGFSRNFGFQKAKYDYFIVFDSDVIVPPNYLQTVSENTNTLDAFGGPDASSPDFSDLQKAINYAMTSVFTTGGIRGKKQNAGGGFQPRSFNMGFSRTVFEKTGGFAQRDMGEDIELSIRIQKAGFRSGLIEKAFVYHKRRGNFKDFFKQIFSFGKTRIILSQKHEGLLKLVHFFPACFTIFSMLFCCSLLFNGLIPQIIQTTYLAYFLAIFIDASVENKSIKIGVLGVLSSFIQLNAYGMGFIKQLIFG